MAAVSAQRILNIINEYGCFTFTAIQFPLIISKGKICMT